MNCEGKDCQEQAEVRVVWSGLQGAGEICLCPVCSMEYHQTALGYILADESFSIQEFPLAGDGDGQVHEQAPEGSQEEAHD